MTEVERKLWHRINRKQLGVRFRRQQPIGRYIVDFVCFKPKIIIEIDEGQHNQCIPDRKRDAWFIKQGHRVLRFWNNEVLHNIDGVIETIRRDNTPSPSSPPIKGGE